MSLQLKAAQLICMGTGERNPPKQPQKIEGYGCRAGFELGSHPCLEAMVLFITLTYAEPMF